MGNTITKLNVQAQLKWLFPGIQSKLNVRQPCSLLFFQMSLATHISHVWDWSAVYVNMDAVLKNNNHFYSYNLNIENEKCPHWVPGLPLEVLFPSFVLLMDLEIRLHLCFFPCLCTTAITCVEVAPEVSQFPHPGSGTPDIAEGMSTLQGAVLLIWARSKHVPSSHVTFCFVFAKAAINTWILVRNYSFGVFTEVARHCCGFHFVWSRAFQFLSLRSTVQEKRCWPSRLCIYSNNFQLCIILSI